MGPGDRLLNLGDYATDIQAARAYDAAIVALNLNMAIVSGDQSIILRTMHSNFQPPVLLTAELLAKTRGGVLLTRHDIIHFARDIGLRFP